MKLFLTSIALITLTLPLEAQWLNHPTPASHARLTASRTSRPEHPPAPIICETTFLGRSV